jgi:hypothetical protein
VSVKRVGWRGMRRNNGFEARNPSGTGYGAPIQIVIKFVSVAADYITPCSRKDPNLNKCALKHGREAIPKFLKGWYLSSD